MTNAGLEDRKREDRETSQHTRTGYVTLVGRPNAGKSTLLNALVGERLSIVTSKAQTTWHRVTGILTTERVQMIFLDTPGLLQPRDLLQESMLASAKEALQEADVLLLVLDATSVPDTDGRQIVESSLAPRPPVPLLVAINKIDAADPATVQLLASWARDTLGGKAFPVSALAGTGIGNLREGLKAFIPEGPFLYSPDDLARDPVRFFVAEMIRETVFEEFHQEIPYSVFCRIEEFRGGEQPVYIQAHLFVERVSQKGILIGKGGSSIRRLGTLSRSKIEAFLGERVYLDLWVKVLPNWRRKRDHLRRLGFRIPGECSSGEDH